MSPPSPRSCATWRQGRGANGGQCIGARLSRGGTRVASLPQDGRPVHRVCVCWRDLVAARTRRVRRASTLNAPTAPRTRSLSLPSFCFVLFCFVRHIKFHWRRHWLSPSHQPPFHYNREHRLNVRSNQILTSLALCGARARGRKFGAQITRLVYAHRKAPNTLLRTRNV